MPKTYNLNRLAYFAAVIETGSFTRAADRLKVTKGVVSSQITQLEQDVQATLLIRSTRKVSPTEAGQIFYARCTTILSEAEEAFEELSQLTAVPAGTLRLTAPNDYGTAIVTPVVAAFRRQYPTCKVEFQLGESLSDLTNGELDLAIRVGWLTDSALQARKLGGFRQLLVGTTDYLSRMPDIAHPDDLQGIDFVSNARMSDPGRCRFENPQGDEVTIHIKNTLSIDSTPALLEAVKAGAGLAVLPDYLVQDHVLAGTLQTVLPGWTLPDGGIYTVYPPSRFRPAKVTAFVSMLTIAEKARLNR
ncbi:LysR family transcriptional regulator [Hoeflea sp.]|uniref:LysR family transcriptional regulator n=1 Tax=Hoeflea sp. TaxID=1940281 RepID=UPI00374A012D